MNLIDIASVCKGTVFLKCNTTTVIGEATITKKFKASELQYNKNCEIVSIDVMADPENDYDPALVITVK